MFRSVIRVLTSTVAAFFGVQSDQRRQKDFSTDSPVPFILMGIFLAACLVAGLLWLVGMVLPN
ncbi:DUF2970 domain-containing protein [Shewanella sp. 3B26]|uniref:DUF2970 domain-containing protein n=1 Tax=Shewanella zhuhaiensis TaxID=2919576 RepID=A0AAJ1EYQ4_9GAMM|nr:DUF2970 domain-containing protein [Shewanella zhuhaiensis]